MKNLGSRFRRDEQGSVVVYVALMMFVFIGFLALSIDTGHWFAVSNELHNAGDACALRGARAFFPDTVSTETPLDLFPDSTRAKNQAIATINLNEADIRQLTDLPTGDVQTVVWDLDKSLQQQPLTPISNESWPPPFGSRKGLGVIVTTRKNPDVNDPVNNFFGNFFDRPTTNVSRVSAAAITPVGGFYKGSGTFPIAVREDLIAKYGDIVYFSPDDIDVGGWTNLTTKFSASASYISKLITGENETEEIKDGDWMNLLNGTACSIIDAIIDKYTKDGILQEVLDNQGKGTGVWRPKPGTVINAAFPRVWVDKFNQKAQMDGAFYADIIEVRSSKAAKDIPIPNTSPQKYTGKCMITLQSKNSGVIGGTMGGGAYYGVMAVQPKLVH